MTEANTELICKNCEHSFQVFWDKVLLVPKRHSLRCKKSYKAEETVDDLVLGPKRNPAHYELCGISRMSSGTCGREGRMWSPRDKKDIFLFIKHSG